ncbi:MAG: hypothetical protein ACRC62_30620 [Microcoleus sp.]
MGKAADLVCGGSGTVLEINNADIDAAVRVGNIDGHPGNLVCGWFGVMELKLGD